MYQGTVQISGKGQIHTYYSVDNCPSLWWMEDDDFTGRGNDLDLAANLAPLPLTVMRTCRASLRECRGLTNALGIFKSEMTEKQYCKEKQVELWAALVAYVRLMVVLLPIFHTIFFVSVLWNMPHHGGEKYSVLSSGFPITSHWSLYLWMLRGSPSEAKLRLILVGSQAVSQLSMLFLGWIYQTPWFVPGFLLMNSVNPFIYSSNSFWFLSFVQATTLALVVTDIQVPRNLQGQLLAGFVIFWAFQWTHLRSENIARRAAFMLEHEITQHCHTLADALQELIPTSRARRFILENQLLVACKQNADAENTEAPWAQEDNNFAGILAIGLDYIPLAESLASPAFLVEFMHNLWCIVDIALDESRKAFTQHASGLLQQNGYSPPFKVDTI
eukprot:gene24093-29237_t